MNKEFVNNYCHLSKLILNLFLKIIILFRLKQYLIIINKYYILISLTILRIKAKFRYFIFWYNNDFQSKYF